LVSTCQTAFAAKVFAGTYSQKLLPRIHLPGVVLPEFIDLQEIENMLAATTDNWLEQSKGRQLGRQEGQTLFLSRLLENKFGSLNAETKATIYSLSESRLLECAEQLLTAQTLQDVIKPASTKPNMTD
jgi:hypothetical protein